MYFKKVYNKIYNFIVKYRKYDKAAFFFFTVISMSLISLLLFLELVEDYYKQGSWLIDMQVYNYFLSIRGEKLNSLVKFITSTGNFISIFIFTSMVMIFLFMKKRGKEAVYFVLSIFGVWIFNESLKYLFKRERPNIDRLMNPSGYSFPSGHAMIFLTFSILLSYYILLDFKNKKNSKLIVVLLVIYAGLVGMSRVYLGVHYFSDVLAGWLVGILWSCTLIVIHRVLIYKKSVKSEL